MKKLNISFWYKPALVLLLLAACLVAAVGLTWARYRTDIPGEAVYESREQATVTLWSLGENGEFSATPAEWVNSEGKKTLTFGVGNYEVDGDGNVTSAAETQGVRIKLLASLGLNYTENTVVEFEILSDEGEVEDTFEATATAIAEGSHYHDTFGNGWVFRFEDEFGEELYWLLEGGEASSFTGRLSLSGVNTDQEALVQLIVESDPALR